MIKLLNRQDYTRTQGLNRNTIMAVDKNNFNFDFLSEYEEDFLMT